MTKSVLKFIKSLQLKKNRIEHQRFLVEGAKSVQELLGSDFEVEMVAATSRYQEQYLNTLTDHQVITVKPSDISYMSSFKNNNSVVAVAKMRTSSLEMFPESGYALVLDSVSDPGNLGTIVRIADWYGIDHIIASPTTTDFYNPKVISASMGSFTRVKIGYTDLEPLVKSYKGKIYGAMMEGTPLYKVEFAQDGLIVMGNESNGISSSLKKVLTDRITIPRYGEAESLNVGIATAIICDRMRAVSFT